jgi:hypothetical protein
MRTRARTPRLAGLAARARGLFAALASDDETLTREFLRLTGSHRALAPLAFAVSALGMLLAGVRLLLTNWRLLLIQIPSAMWIWLAMYDLKAHVLHGKSFNVIKGPILIPLGLLVVAVTAVSFFLNAIFAFSIAGARPPRVHDAYVRARAAWHTIAAWGVAVGVPLAVATLVAPRWPSPWFALMLGAVVGVMMICYVAVPARMIGVKSDAPRRDKLTASVLSSAIGVTVCTPPYVVARVGLLMLGSRPLVIPGIILLVVGAATQAGATGAVRAIKLSAALMAPGAVASAEPAPGERAAPSGPPVHSRPPG